MAFVYVLQGASERYYIGATENLEKRLERHNSGMVHSTKRLGLPLKLVVSKQCESMSKALQMERKLKGWKNPSKVIEFLNVSG